MVVEIDADGAATDHQSRPDRSFPASVRWFSVWLAAAGAAAGGLAVMAADGPRPGLPPLATLALSVSLVAAGRLQLRFSYSDDNEALDLFDAVLAPMVFFLFGPLVVLLAAAAMAVSEAMLRTRPVKACFNVAQWAAGAGAGVLCFAVLADGSALTTRNLGALVAAMTVVAVVNHTSMVVVLAVVTERRVGPTLASMAPIIRVGWLAGGAVNLAFGVLLLAAIESGAWATVLAPASLAMLHWASRGYAEGRADRARMAGLQRATHALVGPIDPRDAIGDFLAEVRACFDVEVVDLVLAETDGHRAHRLTCADASMARAWFIPTGTESLSVSLLDLGTSVRVSPSHPDESVRARLQDEGWRDCLAAPLLTNGEARGIICAYNRTGLQGFETGEMAVLEALARELSGALEKADLVEEVLHQALHDALTGLPNRTLFHQRVQRALTSAKASGASAAVMLIDLNRFKEVNDTLGHHNGDLLLQDFSRRLQNSLRQGDTVARLGGDEFAIVIPNVNGPAGAQRVVARIMRAIDEPFALHDLTLDVDAAIGVALYPDHGSDPATLLQKADVAMYAAKGTLGGYELYSAANDRYNPRRLALVSELRSAASRGELAVHYQPKSDLRSGRVTGVEALLRWHHPRHGPVSPDEFIPIAEQTGSIRVLTSFVLEEALTQCGKWRRAGLDLDIAVNLSVCSLLDTDLPDEIARLLRETAVPAACLTLELTESSMMSDPVRTADVLGRLHSLGAQISIDDYGTGYSSLSYLRRLPVDEMKIDKSFVMSMGVEDNDDVIVRSTVDLGHNLGLRVVAEGVEDAACWARLAALGCDSAQGFWLSHPIPADEVAPLVARLEAERPSSRPAVAS